MKKLLLLIIPILLCLITVNINVKADSDGWYTPDLQEYTFNIPRDSDDFIFKRHDLVTGNFVGFLSKQYDFGVSQNSTGALDFTNIQQTLIWVGERSIQVSSGGGGGGDVISKYGVTPMSLNSLPSYVTYNIYNTLDRTEYKGAVDSHVITYRLDFLGNYSMLLNDYIYDIVYSIVIKYELMIDYFDEIDSFIFMSGYYMHYYDTSEMKEYKVYTPMDSNLLQFQLIQIDYEKGYDDGWNAGYDQGISEVFKMTDKNILLITLIMYILSIFIYFKFRLKWVLIATILLWFVPIFLVDNLFIKIFCVIMIIATITMTFFNEREEF